MASSANADTELLTEHFGYPPVSLLDDIINSVNILAERALNSVEQALLRQPPSSLGFKPAKRAGSANQAEKEAAEAEAAEAHRHEVENGTHQLETLLCASIDRNFDKFEIYVMRNILCVRPEDRDWMRLAHYEGLDFGPAGGNDKEDEDEMSDATIARLHRRLQASLKLGTVLTAETARNEVMLTQLRTLAGRTGAAGGGVKAEPRVDAESPELPSPPPPAAAAAAAAAAASSDPASLAFLLDRGPLTESDVATPLTTTTAFALSQLPALRQLSGELRRMAPQLEEAAAAASAAAAAGTGDESMVSGDGDASWRRERVEYIEGATRKHLERVRGLGLGRNGEVLRASDGASTGGGSGSGSAGQAASAVEPEALTNILSILREHHGPPAKEAPADEDTTMDET